MQTLCVHSKQGVFKEGPSMGVAPTLLHPRGVVPTLLPGTSTNSTDAKGKLPKTAVRHALYNVPDVP